MRKPKECEEAKWNSRDQIVCELRGDVICENGNYLLYTVKNCPKLKDTEYDTLINRMIFGAKQKLIETTIKTFKKFLTM